MAYLTSLWTFIVASAPYLIFGLFAGGVIHQFIPMEKVKKWLGGRNFSTVVKAALVGVPLPLCSCSVIPTAVTLRKSGASNGATSAFLISTPESGVDSLSITYALIDLPMTIIRPIAAFCSAFFAGVLQIFFNEFEFVDDEENQVKKCCGSSTKKTAEVKKDNPLVGVIRYGFGKLSNDIAGWLAVGLLLGAMIDWLVPAHFFSNMSMLENRLMILVIGIPLYICASASTPIAVSLMLKGLSPGSALLLLLVGPATNISNIAVLQKYIGKKGVFLNIFSIVFVAVVFSFLADWLYSSVFELKLSEQLMSHDHHHTEWWQYVCAIFLILLILKGVYKEHLAKHFSK